MRVFVTGATGFIGSAVVKELIGAGRQVLGLARSADKAAALAASGAQVHAGSLEDADDIAAAAARCDGVIHLAFNHDFSKFAANCEDDRRAIATLGGALADSGRPLIVTSGTALTNTPPGRLAREADPPLGSDVHARSASEEAAAALAENGVNVSVVRLPQVHDTTRQGLVSFAIAMYRANGACAYPGDGQNLWPAAHVRDVARLYRLAIEKAASGTTYHAVAEEGVPLRDIAGAIGARLGLPVTSLSPEETTRQFGWLAAFMNKSFPASGARTQAALDWHPTGCGLIADLDRLEVTEE